MQADPSTASAEVAARLLTVPDPGLREQAARRLETIGTAEAAARVAPLIASADIGVRNLAGEVLAGMGEAAVDALARYVDAADADVRKFAIDVLALLPAQKLSFQIAAHLLDPDLNVVLAAVDALGALGAAEQGPALCLLYEHEPLVRPSIINALGQFPGDAYLDLFEEALEDEDPVVQFTAVEAIAAHDAPGALERLLRKAEEVDPAARPVVLDALVGLCESNPDLFRDLPESVRPMLLDVLDDPDGSYRRIAVRGLRSFLDPPVLDRLLRAAGADDQLDVEIFMALASSPLTLPRIFALVADGGLAPRIGADFVLALLAQGAVAADRGPEAATFLGRHFDTFDTETKLGALNVAGQLGTPILDPLVAAARRDPNPDVRTFADELCPSA